MGGMQSGTAENARRSLLPAKCRRATKNAAGSPMTSASSVEQNACFTLKTSERHTLRQLFAVLVLREEDELVALSKPVAVSAEPELAAEDKLVALSKPAAPPPANAGRNAATSSVTSTTMPAANTAAEMSAVPFSAIPMTRALVVFFKCNSVFYVERSSKADYAFSAASLS